MSNSYKETLLLPDTSFPMKGNLPVLEQKIRARWEQLDLFQTMTDKAKGRPAFTLHLGPPFANGNIHAGHALTTILKDFVLRTRFALGYNAAMVPGWDCHGLPIEWKVEERYRNEKKDKGAVPALEFRQECRTFALHWAQQQSLDLQRLGIVADWTHPYMTMDTKAEQTILTELYKFLDNGLIYRDVRPVMWSVVEKTALAAAEIEYHEHESSAVYVRFPVVSSHRPELVGASVVIWTTTPWSIPGNRAIAMGRDILYGLYEICEVTEGAVLGPGDRLILSEASSLESLAKMKITSQRKLNTFRGDDLAGLMCSHPFRNLHDYYQFPVPLLAGSFVTMDTGTGLVSIAPGHGEDDYHLGKAHNLEVPETVGDDGIYLSHVGLFAGIEVLDVNGKEGRANRAVIEKLTDVGALLFQEVVRHQYPHSWRSKAPLIFRVTPQFFIRLDQAMSDGKTLRDKALSQIKETTWIPEGAENRITSMVRDRPDWCISRQRLWGVPIAIFLNKKTRLPLKDAEVNSRIVKAFGIEGADAWYRHNPQDFLGDKYDLSDYDQVMDIVDVWFESGSTHAFVLEERIGQNWPADLYLEGSDQHRGWFQSSLLESVGTRGRAPYKTVVTHGFVVDKEGKKMSKSAGNGLSPNELVSKYGADIVRMWVLAADFHEDVRLSDAAFSKQSELYRKIRNTLKYLLGNLKEFTSAERVDLVDEYTTLPTLEQWVLHRLSEVDDAVRKCVCEYDFHKAFTTVYDFCIIDLSAFYFDIRKDRLYCDPKDAFQRRATRSVLEAVFQSLTAWLSPFIPFTTEEAWSHRPVSAELGGDSLTVHTRLYPLLPEGWLDHSLSREWAEIRRIRGVVTGAIEAQRRQNHICGSLEAHATIYLEADDYDKFACLDWAELSITSQASTYPGSGPASAFRLSEVPGVSVVIEKAEGAKCERSWKILADVGADLDYPELSLRDAAAVRSYRGGYPSGVLPKPATT